MTQGLSFAFVPTAFRPIGIHADTGSFCDINPGQYVREADQAFRSGDYERASALLRRAYFAFDLCENKLVASRSDRDGIG